jgi:elongation factor 2 kinase
MVETYNVYIHVFFHVADLTCLLFSITHFDTTDTDPQVLSNDYRFGDGDLGPRGMALFFKTFRHCGVSDSLGIPIFPLSRNELKVQAKYEDDEITMSDEESQNSGGEHAAKHDNFQRVDLNRLRRSLALKSPRDLLGPSESDTMRTSNMSRADVSKSVRMSLRMSPQKPMHRTRSDGGEVERCLERAKNNFEFTHRNFHRGQSGELHERHKKEGKAPKFDQASRHASIIVRTVSAPMMPTNETIKNLGKVHYQMAVLHGTERFPDVVPEPDGDDPENRASHDAFSVLFHLSHAASLQNAPACLAIARVHAGFETKVSGLLESIVSTDIEAAKHLLRRAMTSPQRPTKPKAAAGCLLYQFLHDEASLETDGSSSATIMMQVIEDTLELMEQAEKEANDVKEHESRLGRRSSGFHKGDQVEANYAMEGTYYSAIVVEVSEDEMITVKWGDDGSEESFSKEHVRPLIPPTATQTSVGGPLSDEEVFGSDNSDDKFLLSVYVLKAELAELKEKAGDFAKASRLYEEAADGAMSDGQMKNATKWSLKAADLQE